MKFKEFREAHDAARLELRVFEGDSNFPGLGRHDRVYDLSPDCYGWPCTVIVRVGLLSAHTDLCVPLTIWCFNRSSEEANPDHLTDNQHIELAEIKRSVTRWMRGAIDELPASTSRHWKTP